MALEVRTMRLELKHPEFGRGDAHFVAQMDREVVLRQTLGDLGTVIKLDQVPAAFGLLSGSQDHRMLRLVAAAMRFRRTLRNGDTLPGELFDGRPSWSPKPHRLVRAVRRLGTAIGAPTAPETDVATLSTAFEELAWVIRSRGLLGDARVDAADIAQIASDAARVDWLCGAVVAVQQCLGALARTANSRQYMQQADAARTAALGLRDAVVWASARAMAADQIVGDPVAALRDVSAFNARLFPLVTSLRAFALDIEPLMTQWESARIRHGGPSAQDFDSLMRIVALRYAAFDPGMFDLDRIRAGLTGIGTENDSRGRPDSDAE